ncbi:cupredoxin domain-containing protein [Natrialba asiatica]|uniref:Blue (Type 1) copper domain-containing protein n=1 Tax=Natrialba asiatica (strain ATCC 700177 / DSM 12278 / JCM 9576 / FERM P-10747 / NBRC 102637 / 172P1) TaxID=29540 RepID=M0AQ71_NATA1|nr:plastocyanin/azurin family copper-binding protein [Natrialba asiatica]ELZ00073.1 blue (type 1) copper domain-containing protein [Natrialba asiatica DSM 12278]
MTNEHRSRDDVSRRGVLKGTAAIAGTAATAGTAGAYRDEIDFRLPATQNDGEGRTLSLLGIVGGWVGVAPAELDGKSNPTLRLIEGEEHEIVWTNGDGSNHNFTVADEDGEVIEATDFVNEQGESLSFTITADEEMAEYYCMPHPVQMRGPIELVDADEVHELRVRVEDENGEPLGAEVFVGDHHSFSDVAARPGQETEESPPSIARFDMLEDGEYELEVWTYGHERVTDTVAIDGDDQEVTVTLPAIEPGDPTETYALRLEEGQWVGVGPDEIADESNPTLEFEAGETYAIEWENAIGRHQPEAENRSTEPLPGHNLVLASGGETNEWDTLVRSDFLDESGETQTVEFVAQEEMGVYLDQSQLDAIGEVTVE